MLRGFCLLPLGLLGLAGVSHQVSSQVPAVSTQVQFAGPSGMEVRWYVKGAADGKGDYPGPPLVVPARYNFKQGFTYRLKLTHIAGYPGLEVYPTLEVPVAGPAAWEFLAHSAVKLELIDADFKQVAAGKYVVKTIHLPSNGTSAAGPPLLVIRLGNLDDVVPGKK